MSRLISYEEVGQSRFMLKVNGQDADDVVSVVKSAKIEEGSRKGLVLDVTVSCLNPAEANFANSLLEDPRLYIGAKWDVRWGYLHDMSPLTKFIVKNFEPDFPESGGVSAKLSLVGKDWYMGRESSARNWGRVNSSDIAHQVANAYSFRNMVIEPSNDVRARAYVQPSNVSDFEYLQQLARRINFVCYVDSDTFYYRAEDWDSSPHLELAYYAGDPVSRLISFKPEVKEPPRARTRVSGDNADDDSENKDESVATDNRNHGGNVIVNGHDLTVHRAPDAATEENSAEEEAPARRRIAEARQRNALENSNIGSAKTLGTPKLRRDTNVLLTGIGTILSGVWHITDVTHDIIQNGKCQYTCTLKTKRGAHRRSGNSNLHKIKVPNGGDFDKPVGPGGAPRVVIVDGHVRENYRTNADPNSSTPLSRQLGISR